MDNSPKTMYAVLDSDCEIIHKLLLTEEQVRLLQWLEDNDYLDRYTTFKALDEVEPISI